MALAEEYSQGRGMYSKSAAIQEKINNICPYAGSGKPCLVAYQT
jgi:hypothetical protein